MLPLLERIPLTLICKRIWAGSASLQGVNVSAQMGCQAERSDSSALDTSSFVDFRIVASRHHSLRDDIESSATGLSKFDRWPRRARNYNIPS
jgi:hypothetical protein